MRRLRHRYRWRPPPLNDEARRPGRVLRASAKSKVSLFSRRSIAGSTPAVKQKVRALPCERARLHAEYAGVDFGLFATADLLDVIQNRARWIRANANRPDLVKRLAEDVAYIAGVLAAREGRRE